MLKQQLRIVELMLKWRQLLKVNFSESEVDHIQKIFHGNYFLIPENRISHGFVTRSWIIKATKSRRKQKKSLRIKVNEI